MDLKNIDLVEIKLLDNGAMAQPEQRYVKFNPQFRFFDILKSYQSWPPNSSTMK
jgi:hypothetical protein